MRVGRIGAGLARAKAPSSLPLGADMALPRLEGRDLHMRVDGQKLDAGHRDPDLRVDDEALVEHAIEDVRGAEGWRSPLNGHNADSDSNGRASGQGAQR